MFENLMEEASPVEFDEDSTRELNKRLSSRELLEIVRNGDRAYHFMAQRLAGEELQARGVTSGIDLRYLAAVGEEFLDREEQRRAARWRPLSWPVRLLLFVDVGLFALPEIIMLSRELRIRALFEAVFFFTLGWVVKIYFYQQTV